MFTRLHSKSASAGRIKTLPSGEGQALQLSRTFPLFAMNHNPFKMLSNKLDTEIVTKIYENLRLSSKSSHCNIYV